MQDTLSIFDPWESGKLIESLRLGHDDGCINGRDATIESRHIWVPDGDDVFSKSCRDGAEFMALVCSK